MTKLRISHVSDAKLVASRQLIEKYTKIIILFLIEFGIQVSELSCKIV